jgi:hypothetical protein
MKLNNTGKFHQECTKIMRLLMGVFFSLQKRKNLTAQEKLW